MKRKSKSSRKCLSDEFEFNLQRTVTLHRVIREPPLFRALILYSSRSSGVKLLITRIHLSPSRVMLYFDPFEISLVPLYLQEECIFVLT